MKTLPRRRTLRTGRPNIVLFISDQQRADVCPGGGMPGLVTPHLDWLAEHGQTFRNAFCTTPICSPSRASLLSGLYPHRHGLVSNHQERAISREIGLSREVPLLADMLAPHGYACGYVGKWHLGTGSDRRGFSTFVRRHGDHDVSCSADNEMLHFAEKVGVKLRGKLMGLQPHPARYETRTQVGSSELPLAFHPSFRDAVAAGGFIRSRKHEANPFLLVYSCHEPHVPFVSPRPFDTMIAPDAVELPGSWQTPMDPGLIAKRQPFWRLEGIEGRLTESDLRTIWAAYLGAVAYVDHLLGVLIEALVDTDQVDDTIVIFVSDHGDMMGAHNLLLKGAVLYDEVVRVPLIVRVPGSRTRAGRDIRSLASLADIVPTIMRLCDLPVPDRIQGRDLSPLLHGPDRAVHQGVALEFHSSNWGENPAPLRGWRTPEWKYIEDPDGPVELYDLRSDPNEVENLVRTKRARGVRERLRSELQRWLTSSGDPWPSVPQPRSLVKDPKKSASTTRS